MSCKSKDKFKTSEASTKAWMRTNGAIDKFLNIIDPNAFNKLNEKVSKYATKNYGTSGKLFLREADYAVPNKALFKSIDKANGVNYAEERTLISGDYTEEDMDTFERKIEMLKENMDVDVILDSDVETSRVLGANDPRTIAAGRPVILINPARIFKTTAIHEFSHIFIDAFPNGLANNRLQKALNSLRATDLWREVESMYPDLSEDDLHKEILATAIGRKGSEVWDERTSQENKTAWDTFKTWVMDYLKRTFALEAFAVEELTKELLDNRVQADLLENLNIIDQELREGYRFKSQTTDDLKIESSLESIYDQVQARISTIFRMAQPRSVADKAKETLKKVNAAAKGQKTAFEKIAELKELLEEYSTKNQITGLLKYNKWSRGQISQMKARIATLKAGGKMTAEIIGEFKVYNSAFELLDEVETMIISLHDKGEISDSRKKTFVRELSEINAERASVNKELLSAQREVYARLLADNSNLQETEYRLAYEKDWNTIRPQESMYVWVNKKMEEGKEDREKEAHAFYRAMAEKSITDISSFSGIFANEKNISSTEIQVISRIIDAMDMATDSFVQTAAANTKAHHTEFSKDHGSGNMETKYKEFIEQDEDGAFSLTSKYLPEFHRQHAELAKIVSDIELATEKFKGVTWVGLTYTTVDGVSKQYTADKNVKNIKINGAFIEYKIGKKEYSKPIAQALAEKEMQEWTKANTEKVMNGQFEELAPKDKWLNGKYANMSASNMAHLEKFKDMINEADLLYETENSLIRNLMGSQMYNLPGVTRSTMERVMEGHIGSAAIDRITDMFKRKDDEFELQEENPQDKLFKKVFADVTNKEKLNIPIPYRKRLKGQEQSLDLHSILLMNLEGAKNYEQKKKGEAQVNIIIDVMGTRTIPDYEGLRALSKIHGFAGSKIIQVNKSKDSLPNDFKKALDMAENRIYGIKEKSAGEIGGVNVQKAMSTYMAYASNVSLVGNYLNSIINATSGTVSNLIEVVGGETYGYKDWVQAKKDYWSDAKNIIDDIGTNVSTSKTNLLMNYFNVMGGANAMNNRFESDSKIKSLLSIHSLRALDHGGEHMMQGQTMYAVLNSVKVLNKKGEYLNKDGKVVATKEEAASMVDAINFVPNANGDVQLELKSFAVANTFSPGGGTSDQLLLDMRGLIKKKTIDLYGVYDDNLKAAAQREWWGKLLFFLKKWIEPAGYRRWRGVSSALSKVEDLRDVDRFYSEDLKQYQEGYYVTAIRFIANLKRDMKGLQLEMIALNYEKLSNHEKANLRRLGAEVGMITMTLLAYIVAGGWDEDPDDDTLVARYLLRKEISELTYFLNPAEGIKLMSSPTAALGVVNRNLAVLNQIFNYSEKYESGVNKDRYKLWVKLRKSTPFIASFLEKDLDSALRFQQNN